MKIAIIGSHSVGKTTLVHELSKHIDLPVITEVARAFPRDSTKSAEWEIIRNIQIFNAQLIAEYKHKDGFLSDRSTIDNSAYMTLALHTRASMVEFDLYTDTILTIHKAIEYANGYDYIFYIPIEFKAVADGFRDTDERIRKYIDDIIIKTLFICNIPFTEIRGSVEERVQKILDIIGESND